MMTLVTGGSKCGKSSFAESLFDDFSGNKIYIATMIPFGEEAHTAIENHRKNRIGKGFVTIEKYTDIDEIDVSGGGLLLECMGNLVANEMFSKEEIADPAEKIISGIKRLNERSELFVVVTNDVSRDGIIYEKSTLKYIEFLSKINCQIAEIADRVAECVYGIPIFVKGERN